MLLVAMLYSTSRDLEVKWKHAVHREEHWLPEFSIEALTKTIIQIKHLKKKKSEKGFAEIAAIAALALKSYNVQPLKCSVQ